MTDAPDLPAPAASPPGARLPVLPLVAGAAGAWGLFAAMRWLLPVTNSNTWTYLFFDQLFAGQLPPHWALAVGTFTGILLAPLTGIWLLAVLVVRCATARPRPQCLWLFACCLVASVCDCVNAGGSASDRRLAALLPPAVAALVGTAEVLARGLRSHYLTAACMLGISAAWSCFCRTVLLCVGALAG